MEENIKKYNKRTFFNYAKTDAYIIDHMKELCEEFNSVLNYYENPIKFQEEETKRKVREEYEKKFLEKNKEEKSYNNITRSAEESEKKQKRKINNEELEYAKIIEARIKYYEKMKMNKNKKKELINWIRDFDAKKNKKKKG